MLGDLGNLFIQAVAVPGIWDTQCGFKAFTQEAAEQIFFVARVDRWAFDIEALALAQHFRYRIGLVPAYWIDEEGTHVRSLDYITTLLETVRIRWNLFSGSYGRRSSVAHKADVAG
jgi:dolichyl-phosphate beta-glucosyltransferase